MDKVGGNFVYLKLILSLILILLKDVCDNCPVTPNMDQKDSDA